MHARSARAVAAILTAWLGKAAHKHTERLRAICDWSPWSTHVGITQYESMVMPITWDLRALHGIHLVAKSYVEPEDLTERLRTFNAGTSLTERWGFPLGPFLLACLLVPLCGRGSSLPWALFALVFVCRCSCGPFLRRLVPGRAIV